ncbi:MAG: hypothetical protein ACYCS4_12980 [Acidimicrobiales bacterium]
MPNITPGDNGFMGQHIHLVSQLSSTIGTIAFVAMLLCVFGFILGAALYAYSARQGHTRSHEATRLILGSLIGLLLFGGLDAITSMAFNAGHLL